MGRTLALLCSIAILGAPPALRAQAIPPDPELVAGVRQVREGDFEGAVTTLDGVARRLTGVRERSRDFAQACLYLGVAYVALDQKEAARVRFREALAQDGSLRLSPEEFSPKVIGVFEAARKEARTSAGAGGSKTGLVVLGLGAAAGGVALAARGGAEAPPAPGTVTVANARFGTPVIECPNGSNGVPIAFTILVEAVNGTPSILTIASVSTTVIIVSSTIPSEINLASSYPSSVKPTTVAPQGRATLEIGSTLVCTNAPGNSPRFNEWSGRVTSTTSAGVFPLETADRLRVNVP